MWRLPALILVAVAMAACSGRSSLERVGNVQSAYRTLPRPAPLPVGAIEHATFRTLEGTEASLKNIVGQGKVVVLNFWATWCRPCRMEIPTLTAINRELRDKGVEIVGLSVEDPQESTEAVRMFASQYGIDYRIGFASDEVFESFSGPNQSQIVPQTMVFDKTGKLTLHLRGLHPDFPAVLKECIEESL